jgi:hypothetical protein
MGLKNTAPPRLPAAPTEYDAQFIEQYTNVLRIYFNFLNSAAPVIFASQNIGATDVVTAISFAQPDPTTPGKSKISLPTQADFANLRSGDVYYDTSGGAATSYPLRIKA